MTASFEASGRVGSGSLSRLRVERFRALLMVVMAEQTAEFERHSDTLATLTTSSRERTTDRDRAIAALRMFSAREALERIENALVRIDDGSYAICQSCGRPIALDRPRGDPTCAVVRSVRHRFGHRGTPTGGSDMTTVVVNDAARGRLTQEIWAGRHKLIADEPAGVGDDLGPTPYDLLLAALGACTAMTLRLYADRKGWPLEHVSVELAHDRVHADDSRHCDKEHCRIEQMDSKVSLRGPLNEEQRQRLLEIAERCPVHRTLMGEKRIVTRSDSVGSTVL